MATNLESGWNENDYNKFSHDLSQDMKEGVTISEFNSQRDDAYSNLGNHLLSELVTIHKNPDNIMAIWKIKFEKRNEPGLGIYRFKEINNKLLIVGAMFHA